MDAEMDSNQHIEEIKNKDKECQPRKMDEEEMAENRNMELETNEMEKQTSMPARKSKRGRKKKNRAIHDGSTDSDSDLFNYDKFLKKVSKKGTRVHMNVRMFAVRTIVPGSKAVLQNVLKTAMNSKEGENLTSTTNNQQQKQKRKVEVVPKHDSQQQSAEEYGDSENINSPSQKRSNSDYLHAGEDFYNVKGYDIGRYNLRRRTQQKKYYDDDPEVNEEDDDEGKQRKPYGYNDDYKQNYGANPGYVRRAGAPDTNFQNKSKRKKKDDDEDYVAEEDDEYDDNEEARGGNNKYAQPLPNFSSMPGMQGMSHMQQTAPIMQSNSNMQPGANMSWMSGMPNMQSMQNMQSVPNPQWSQNMRAGQNTQSMQNMRPVQNQQWMPNMQSMQGMPNMAQMQGMSNTQNMPNTQNMQSMPQNPNQLAFMMNAQNQRNFQGNFGQNMRSQGMNGMYFQPPNGMMGQNNGQNMNRMYGQPNMQNYYFNR